MHGWQGGSRPALDPYAATCPTPSMARQAGRAVVLLRTGNAPSAGMMGRERPGLCRYRPSGARRQEAGQGRHHCFPQATGAMTLSCGIALQLQDQGWRGLLPLLPHDAEPHIRLAADKAAEVASGRGKAPGRWARAG